MCDYCRADDCGARRENLSEMSLCLIPDFVVWAGGTLCSEGDCKGVFHQRARSSL